MQQVRCHRAFCCHQAVIHGPGILQSLEVALNAFDSASRSMETLLLCTLLRLVWKHTCGRLACCCKPPHSPAQDCGAQACDVLCGPCRRGYIGTQLHVKSDSMHNERVNIIHLRAGPKPHLTASQYSTTVLRGVPTRHVMHYALWSQSTLQSIGPQLIMAPPC
jgi:hypothetical protein